MNVLKTTDYPHASILSIRTYIGVNHPCMHVLAHFTHTACHINGKGQITILTLVLGKYWKMVKLSFHHTNYLHTKQISITKAKDRRLVHLDQISYSVYSQEYIRDKSMQPCIPTVNYILQK